MNIDDADTLVTGATGLLGRWLLAALTAQGRQVVAVVRGAPAREAELRAFVERLGGVGDRLQVVAGDVESPDLALAGRFAGVRDVYHLAARFDFGLAPAVARRANVDGTLHALAWARARPALRRFVFLGGYRMPRPPAVLRDATHPLPEPVARRLYREYGAYEALHFLSEDRYDTAEADRHADAIGLARPAVARTLTRWIDHLVLTRFA